MITLDARRASREEHAIFRQVKLAEVDYSRRLRQLAKNIVIISRDMLANANHTSTEVFVDLARIIDRYGDAITPWANVVAAKMVNDVSLRDARLWRERAKSVSWDLQALIQQSPIGTLLRQRMADQVDLITSIPRDVAQEVHKLAIETSFTGQRYTGIVKTIMASTEATISRANLIARTEVARTTTEITKARAQFAGSEGYIWRTAHDQDVRRLHKELEGQYILWDTPPIAGENGERAHAGCIYNCRCVTEVIFGGKPDRIESWRYVGG